MFRILAVVVFLVIVIIVIGVIGTLAVAAFKALVRFVTRLAISVFVSVLVSFLVRSVGQPWETATWVGILAFPFIAILVWKWLGLPGNNGKALRAEDLANLVAARERRDPSPVRLDTEVEASWDAICSHLPGSEVAPLEHSREQCRLLLHFADEPRGQADAQIAEQAMMIRRHVPALASELRDAVILANDADRALLIAKASEMLRSLGHGSFELLEVVRRHQQEALEVRSRHLANRMQGDGDLHAF